MILFGPERVIVGHRFAPVAHREVGIDFRRLTKRLERFLVPERMQRREPTQKVRLRFLRSGRRKLHPSELRLLRADVKRTVRVLKSVTRFMMNLYLCFCAFLWHYFFPIA